MSSAAIEMLSSGRASLMYEDRNTESSADNDRTARERHLRQRQTFLRSCIVACEVDAEIQWKLQGPGGSNNALCRYHRVGKELKIVERMLAELQGEAK